MGRGKRYEEPKLNLNKVFAVVIAFIVLVMFIFMIKGFFKKDGEQTRITSKDYFSAFQNNKWGIIDSTGAVVIDPSYEEMIVVPNSKKDVFLCTFDVNYETGEYKTKALNSKNEEIFTQYNQVEPLQVVDKNGQVTYIGDALKVQKDGKYGLINLDGNELQPCQYDSISTLEGKEDVLKVYEVLKKNQYGQYLKDVLDGKYMELLY